MLHVRLVVPADRRAEVVEILVDDARVTNVVVLPGAGLDPPGDVVDCDVAREGASDVLGRLRHLGLDENGSVTLSGIEAAPSRNARAAERAAPGAPDDAVVWDIVEQRAWGDAAGSWSYYVFLTLATLLAGVAVVTDSAILVVGAMVVGPEFAAVAAVAVSIAVRNPPLTVRALRLLVAGFAVAIAITALAGLAARAAGWVDPASLRAPRPLTAFIWHPDRWSVVVALLAGAAGVLSQTGGKANALVGVFISVTTVPAAGNLALAIAVWVPGEMGGAAAQLAVNLTGMTVAGVLTLLVQRTLWRRVRAHGRVPQPAPR
ncbi:MAG: DUF389 domain-containing protein [bacterium]